MESRIIDTFDMPPRVNVLGVGIHCVDMDSVCNLLLAAASRRERGYVCVRDVNGVVAALKDPELRRIHNQSLLTVPDGVPNVWIGRLRGHRSMRRVYGPDLMLEVCRRGVPLGCSHFLYGGGAGVVEKLAGALQQRFPGLKIAGTMTPPFRRLTDTETDDLKQQVADARPDFFWVGISTPKQERFMAAYTPRLDAGIMLGVGAAFDIHAGIVRDAPRWIKPTGFQWMYRLYQEPRRLWRRYLLHNPVFIAHVMLQLTGLRKYPMDTV